MRQRHATLHLLHCAANVREMSTSADEQRNEETTISVFLFTEMAERSDPSSRWEMWIFNKKIKSQQQKP
jgi:hypothetical protein